MASTTGFGRGHVDHVGTARRRGGLRERRRGAGYAATTIVTARARRRLRIRSNLLGSGEPKYNQPNDRHCRRAVRPPWSSPFPPFVTGVNGRLRRFPQLSRFGARGSLRAASSPAQGPTTHLDCRWPPDGRQLVYPAAKAGVVSLWLHDLSSGETRAAARHRRRRRCRSGRRTWRGSDSSRAARFARSISRAARSSDLADAPSGRGAAWNRVGRSRLRAIAERCA